MTRERHVPSPAGTAAPGRLHAFDALRAAAMLLGIALHAGLAFAPYPWLVMNKETSPAIGLFIEVLHGFRMPLFFLMSGFFSAMLLQRRGVAGFVRHRCRRIALPLFLSMLTILPATWGAVYAGNALQRAYPAPGRAAANPSEQLTIWRAAARGDLDAVMTLTVAGEDLNTPDDTFVVLPLAWAATGDHADIVAYLLEMGADPNQRMGDENTPMHTACFYGAADSVARMLAAGGDPTLPNKHGETPLDAMRHGADVVAFISSILGVEVGYERVETGRRQIAAMLEDGGQTAGAMQPAGRWTGWLTGELLMHLWFLWHLCWLACGLVLAHVVWLRLSWGRVPSVLTSTPLCLLFLLPLTTLTQSFQANFGPDTSAAMIPAPHVLLHYAVFFGFGVLMHRSHAATERLGRCWWAYLPAAAASCILALGLAHNSNLLGSYGVGPRAGAWVGYATQSVFVWTASFGLIGLVRSVVNRPRARIRYLSDSAYWLYLAHLPVVLAGQTALLYVPLPPVLEFVGLTVFTSVVLLMSYRWLVRPTWIGRLLNGTRYASRAA